MAAEIHLNDIGTVFQLTVRRLDGDVEDQLGSASVMQIKFLKPDGEIDTQPADLTGDGSDGNMQYVSVDGDLDQDGEWKLQGYIELGGGKWNTSIRSFNVDVNL